MSKWIYSKSVPEKLYLACSGGVDSIAVAHILSQWRDVTLCHFGHNDGVSHLERSTVEHLANRLGLPLIIKDSELSLVERNKEAEWRKDRYEWFHTLSEPVVTAHTLNDAVEWYLMTCLRGRGEYLPYQNKNVIRPFLLTTKAELTSHAMEHGLHWWEDPGNHDASFSLRSKVRSSLLPTAVACEPGLFSMVRKNLIRKIKDEP
jgi:tRNA(Ile)-lysidine synthase